MLDSREKEYWYFAFGSNMSSDVFAKSRGMSPIRKEMARLDGYKLAFDQKGIAIIEPAFASIQVFEKSEVWGVLYQLTEADFNRLHYTEGANYQVRSIEVMGCSSGTISCYTYMGIDSVSGLSPSRRYASELISGAKENDLPTSYIQYLEGIKTTYVPLISEIAGLIMKLILWYTAKGKNINFGVGSSGAKASEQHQDKA